MTGASRFPRHWVYDHEGALQLKSGLADFRDWYGKSFGRHTPWGDQDSEALVTEVESSAVASNIPIDHLRREPAAHLPRRCRLAPEPGQILRIRRVIGKDHLHRSQPAVRRPAQEHTPETARAQHLKQPVRAEVLRISRLQRPHYASPHRKRQL